MSATAAAATVAATTPGVTQGEAIPHPLTTPTQPFRHCRTAAVTSVAAAAASPKGH